MAEEKNTGGLSVKAAEAPMMPEPAGVTCTGLSGVFRSLGIVTGVWAILQVIRSICILVSPLISSKGLLSVYWFLRGRVDVFLTPALCLILIVFILSRRKTLFNADTRSMAGRLAVVWGQLLVCYTAARLIEGVLLPAINMIQVSRAGADILSSAAENRQLTPMEFSWGLSYFRRAVTMFFYVLPILLTASLLRSRKMTWLGAIVFLISLWRLVRMVTHPYGVPGVNPGRILQTVLTVAGQLLPPGYFLWLSRLLKRLGEEESPA